MKAKSRRRLLVSSVAMLLVAMLALGTATFAWFTSSTSITADQINVYTTKSSELELSKADLKWSKTGIHYGMTTANKLAPVSSLDGSSWFSAYAAASTAMDKNAQDSFTAVSNTQGYVWSEMLNIKNTGGQASNVTITVNAATFSSAARLAIIPVANQTEPNTPSAYTAELFQANIYCADANEKWNPATTGKTASTTELSAKGVANNATISVGQLAAEGGQASYAIVVWFEGQDSDCYDNYNGGFTVPAISFSVSGTAV